MEDRKVKFAYADPPYIGQARKLYDCAEVDHTRLLEQLAGYDGWALSASSPSLRELLPMCPADVRIGGWFKPFCIFKPNVNPAYAWEPVLFRGARKRSRKEPTVRDWHSANVTLKKGLCGAKPESFCTWIIQLLGLQDEDTLDDLFPGTGVMGKVREAVRAGGAGKGEDDEEDAPN